VNPYLEALQGSFAGETLAPPQNIRNLVCGTRVREIPIQSPSIVTKSGAGGIKVRKLRKFESRGWFAFDWKNHLPQMRLRDASSLIGIPRAPRLSPPTFVAYSGKMVALSPMQWACGCSAQQPKVFRFGSFTV
jgi:hypothetical protein